MSERILSMSHIVEASHAGYVHNLYCIVFFSMRVDQLLNLRITERLLLARVVRGKGEEGSDQRSALMTRA